MSSRQPTVSRTVAVPLTIRSRALPSHTSVPWEKPDRRTRVLKSLGWVSTSMPAGEAGVELRNGHGAGGAQQLVVLKAQHLGGGEDAHGVRVVQGDGPGVDPGEVLQHADHGGVIVAQHVQLQQVILHAVVFKMGGDGVDVLGVGGVLHGGRNPPHPCRRGPPPGRRGAGRWCGGPPRSPAVRRFTSALPAVRPRSSRYFCGQSRRRSFPPGCRWCRPGTPGSRRTSRWRGGGPGPGTRRRSSGRYPAPCRRRSPGTSQRGCRSRP